MEAGLQVMLTFFYYLLNIFKHLLMIIIVNENEKLELDFLRKEVASMKKARNIVK